jgi:hypothetical protein
MSKSVRRFLSFLLVLQLIIPYPTFAAAIGEFTSVVGEVTQTRVKEVIRPVAKSPIEMKDLIVTDQASSAMMVLSDDSTIKLEQNSKLEIKEFLFKEKSRTGIFSLAIGKVTVAVNKFIGGDNVFEVRSPTAAVGVRGTGFEFIESMEGGEPTATVICTEGSLTISALSPAGVIIATEVLLAGQTAVIKGGIITISATIAGAAAAAATGLSTGAKIGIVAGALVLTGGVAAVAAGSSGGGGGDSGGGGGTLDTHITQQTLAATWGVTGSSTWGATTSGTIPLSPGGTYTYNLSTVQPGRPATTQTGTGTWTLSGSTLSLRFDAGAVYTGTTQGDSTNFSMVCDNGWTLNFSRR